MAKRKRPLTEAQMWRRYRWGRFWRGVGVLLLVTVITCVILYVVLDYRWW